MEIIANGHRSEEPLEHSGTVTFFTATGVVQGICPFHKITCISLVCQSSLDTGTIPFTVSSRSTSKFITRYQSDPCTIRGSDPHETNGALILFGHDCTVVQIRWQTISIDKGVKLIRFEGTIVTRELGLHHVDEVQSQV